MSFRKLAITAAIVLALIVVGVVTGAQLWRPMATVERHVVAPIQRVTNRASPSEMLPDLVDTACPAVVRIGLGVPPIMRTPSVRSALTVSAQDQGMNAWMAGWGAA